MEEEEKKSPRVRFLGFLTQPLDTDSTPFELDESDVIWSSSPHNNNNNNLFSPPDSPSISPTPSPTISPTPSPSISPTPSPTNPQSHHSFRTEKFFGLSAALSDDQRPLVQRKLSLNHSLFGARMIPSVSYPRSNGSDGSGSFSGKFHQSAPVNVPVWPAANKFNASETENFGFFEEDEMLPPHEIVARSQSTTFSVFEGVGRTLKGRDSLRVRNTVWQITGNKGTGDFEDVGHSDIARKMREEYYIGEIGPSTVPKVYSFEDVSQHNKTRDCWLIISEKVYDVTPFMDDHPGGDEVLLSATGKDATNDFEDVGHSTPARELMAEYYIGEIDPSTVPLRRTYVPLPQPHGEAPVAVERKFRSRQRFENVEKIEDPRKEVSNTAIKSRLKIDEDQTDSAHTKVVIATEKKQELEKVIETARVVDVLEEGANGNSNSIELLLDELGRKKIRQYSHKDLTSITENFSNQIGSGAYGDVFKGKLPIGVQVAVKKLKDNTMNVMEFTFMAEVRTMSSTLHRHLVILHGYCFEVNMKALVYEYLENGSFDKILYENHLNLPWEKLYEIAIGTAKGLSYLHEGCVHEIVHYDVKPGNVLLDSKLCPKVADFGMAKVSQRDLSHISLIEFRGTRSYAAPEMWMQMPVTSKSDIYSFGMMLFEVLGRKKNLDGKNWLPGQVWEKFKKGQLDEIMDECGIAEKDKTKAKTLATIALWCTQYRPNDRPMMSVVVQVLMGNIQLPSPPDPLYPYSGSSSGSTWGGGSTKISGLPTSPISTTTSI